MKDKYNENRIKYLQRTYSETNVARDECLSKETISDINKKYHKRQRQRKVDAILNNVRNKDSIKKEVHQIVEEIPNFKVLCSGCKEELIISVIILYVQKTRNSRYHVEATGLWKKYELNWQKYSLILTRLLMETRKNSIQK